MNRRRSAQADVVVVPRTDLEQLHEELARLRLERHRTLNLAEVGRSARAFAEAAVDSDEAWHAVTEAQALRASLLGVLRDLQIAAGQLERQLGTATPAAEVDRRVAPERHRPRVAEQRAQPIRLSALEVLARDLTQRHPDHTQRLMLPLLPDPVIDLESDNDMVVLP